MLFCHQKSFLAEIFLGDAGRLAYYVVSAHKSTPG